MDKKTKSVWNTKPSLIKNITTKFATKLINIFSIKLDYSNLLLFHNSSNRYCEAPNNEFAFLIWIKVINDNFIQE